MSHRSVYISHTPESEALATRLRAELVRANISIAPRRHEVPAGTRWKPALKKAGRFLACFAARDDGQAAFAEDELAIALEHMHTLPADQPWLVPVKLTACDIPQQFLSDEVLDGIDAIDLSADWDGGIARIVSAFAAAQVAPQAKHDAAPSPSSDKKIRVKSAHFGQDVEFTNVAGTGGGAGSAKMTEEIDHLIVDGNTSFVNRKSTP